MKMIKSGIGFCIEVIDQSVRFPTGLTLINLEFYNSRYESKYDGRSSWKLYWIVSTNHDNGCFGRLNDKLHFNFFSKNVA